MDIERLSPERQRLARLLRERRAAAGNAGPQRRDRSQPAPLSSSQLRLWFLQQWAPEAPTFNAVRALRLVGDLDANALEQAFSALLARHESLRTVFASEGGAEPHQVVLDARPLEMPRVDLSGLVAGDRDVRLHAAIRELAREPFDLAGDLMLRVTLFRLADDEHVALLRIHHIAGDAISAGVLLTELGALYNAIRASAVPALPEPPIQFADVAVWQRERLRGDRLAEMTAYWVRHLEGAPPVLALPLDRPRPAVQRHAGAHRHFVLPADVAAAAAGLARDERATVYMVGLAAFAALLYRLGGEPDVVIGSPIANRTHAELAHVVGFLSNTVALRVPLGANPSFRAVVGRAREATLGAVEHQEMPFDQIVSALALPRDAGHNPVFQVNFRCHATAPTMPLMDGLQATPVAVDIGYSRFDLAMELQFSDEGVDGYLEYDLDLFDAATIDHVAETFDALMRQVLADPDLPVLAVSLPPVRRSRPRPARTRGRRT